ncbi:type II toxin-antitoxin system VapC family toxin [Algiphilus aromaticivorans]|uniref:type II toxin-antitoxin system VapC family toxin n=1 Tax=Algiphilus aromaticivorans TaxID=382454 RepID=UPI0005C138F0|nr:type II toxin-antitoxin system VapC family toxin [Algiphilus aromaticivorans]
MYLIDTNVVSELRKGRRADPGVRAFFEDAANEQVSLFLSVITLAELDAGVTRVRGRGDHEQAAHLAAWLQAIRRDYGSSLLAVDESVAAQLGPLLAHGRGGVVDRMIMAAALAHGLTVVTRNTRDFAAVATRNPFAHQ